MKFTAAAFVGFAAVVAATPALSGWDEWSSTTSADPAKVSATTSSTTTKSTTTTSTSTTEDWGVWSTTTSDPKKSAVTTTSSSTTASTTTSSAVWGEWDPEPSWTTTVVTAITTFCPGATTLTHAGKTYTITTATTLTITDCPCTVSVPVFTKTSTSCLSSSTKKATTAPYPTTTDGWDAWSSAGTGVAHSTGASASKTTSKLPVWTGAANREAVGMGAAVVAGLALLL